MEKFDHQEYRNKLAKDLKEIPDHEERKEAIKEKQDLMHLGYHVSKKEHLRDIRRKHGFKDYEAQGVDIEDAFGNYNLPKTFENFKKWQILKEDCEYDDFSRSVNVINKFIDGEYGYMGRYKDCEYLYFGFLKKHFNEPLNLLRFF